MDAEVDALYGLPADQFTAARDALAARLRADGRREEAAAVRALRRPTVAAAALNRAVRAHPGARDELLAAGRNLTRAQERLVAGEGDRAVMREAAEHVREAISALAALASSEAGLSPASADRVRATLQAALVDDDVREAVSGGRLEREAEAAGGGFGAPTAPAAVGSRAPKDRRRQTERPPEPDRDARRAEAAERLKAATGAARDLERQLEKAVRRAERTAATVDDLRARLSAAESEAQSAADEADALRRRLREAKAEAAAAQAALDDSS